MSKQHASSRLEFVIPPHLDAKRLDHVLALQSGYSRSSVTRLIKAGSVTVDGVVAAPDLHVHTGSIIVVHITDAGNANLPVPTIIADTEDYLVLNKPAGLLVHGKEEGNSIQGDEPSLVDWLLKSYPQIALVGDTRRPGIVHRLDRLVSGVMVIAKTPLSYEHLLREFRERHVKKMYTALVSGDVAKDTDTITFPLARSARTGRIAARPHGTEGREAITEYWVQRRFRSATLLSVSIHTGRTHQIRAHLLAIGHPIAGDAVYGLKGSSVPVFPRLMLHSSSIGFSDRAGQEQTYEAPLPADFVDVLESFGAAPSSP